MLILIISKAAMAIDSNSTNDPFEWLKSIFDKGITSVENLGSYLLIKIVELLLFISRIVYISVGIIGAILWLSHLQPLKGRRMVIGALFLALVTEFLKVILA
ncbi:MAG TPA: hypothetical protein VKU94_02085 [Geobacterales bacterium]|nr:hypothetical protein [Geobacterales bacterium]